QSRQLDELAGGDRTGAGRSPGGARGGGLRHRASTAWPGRGGSSGAAGRDAGERGGPAQVSGNETCALQGTAQDHFPRFLAAWTHRQGAKIQTGRSKMNMIDELTTQDRVVRLWQRKLQT